MGLKDFLKNNFIDLGSSSEPKEIINKPIVDNSSFPNFNPTTPTNAVSQYTASPSPVNNSDETSKKFKLHFEKIFEEANLPKPDFYDFKKMIEAMEGIPDVKSYPVCFNALAVQGLTLEKLIASANKYVEILDNDNKSFFEQLKNKSVEDVASKETAAEQLKVQNDEKLKSIQQLTTEINDNNLKIQELTLTAQQSSQKLKDKENNFLFALQSMQLNLKRDIERINQLLTPIKNNG